jgi:hypothetical protein
MNGHMRSILKFIRDESGATAIEPAVSRPADLSFACVTCEEVGIG